MLWNKQNRGYLHDVLIPSEPQHFCLDKLIPEALPLLEAPPLFRLVHLYKLLCGGTFYTSHTFKHFTYRSVPKAGKGKHTHTAIWGEFCGWRTCGGRARPTWAVQVGPRRTGLQWQKKLNRPPFLGHYGELHHADVSLLLNKNAGLHFRLVQRRECTRHVRNTFRELTDQASCFPYKKWQFHCLLVQRIIMTLLWPVFCAAAAHKDQIILAIDEYHNKTSIRFKQYDPLTDKDYVYITGENSGCWSYVGRIGRGVSSRVRGVVKTNTALRNAPLRFRSQPLSFPPQKT